MIHLRRETDYAIHLLKKLTAAKGGYLSLQEVSSSTGISFHFLQKIARKLRMAKLIKGEKGAIGGYCLNIDPEKINLKMIINATEGSSAILPCYNVNKCTKCVKIENKCFLKKKLAKINDKILSVFESVKLKNL